jgi:hypothetical protein
MIRFPVAAAVLISALLTLGSCDSKDNTAAPQPQSLSGNWVMTIQMTPQFNTGAHSLNGQDHVTITSIAPPPGAVAGEASYVVGATVQLASADTAYLYCNIAEGGSGTTSTPLVLRGTTSVQAQFRGSGLHHFAVKAILSTGGSGTDPNEHAVAFALSEAYTNPDEPVYPFPTVTLALQASGAQLTGTTTLEGDAPVPILDGQVNGSNVSFKARLFDPDEDPWVFSGQLTGSALTGTVETLYFTTWEERMPWSAHR